MKRALVIAILLAAPRAHADDCTPAPVDDKPRALHVELSAPVTTDGDWGPTIVASQGSLFPAISADGKTIVELYADQQDFVGTPIASVVFYTRTGQKSFQWMSDKDTRAADAIVKSINARFAKSKWRALPVAGACAKLAGGIAVSFDEETEHVTVTRGAKKTSASFPAAGDIIERDLGSGGCGAVTGIDRVFGDRRAGFVVVEPRVNLGGDSCAGRPIADVAITVRVP